jgi:hypothetical protein
VIAILDRALHDEERGLGFEETIRKRIEQWKRVKKGTGDEV